MVSLLKSKKGGIPAINEIVMTFLNITPKPILILIFLLLLTVIGAFVVPTLLSTFGYSCVERSSGAIELYKVPMSNFGQKFTLDIERGFQSMFGAEEYSLIEDPFPNGDKTRLRIREECFVKTIINGTEVSGYTGGCVNCKLSGGFFQVFTTPARNRICIGDGTEPRQYLSANRYFCGQCAPPEEYYYNHTNCITEDECYFTIRNESLVSSINEDYVSQTNYQKIIELGGVLKPQDSSQMTNIQCTENQQPSLYFFSIEIFNLKMWTLLVAVSILIIFAFKYYAITI